MCLYVKITRPLSSNQGLRLDFIEILAELSLKGCIDKCIYFFNGGGVVIRRGKGGEKEREREREREGGRERDILLITM